MWPLSMPLGIIPWEVDASKLFASPVFTHFVVFVEDSKEVVSMLLVNVFNTKIIDNENELDGTP